MTTRDLLVGLHLLALSLGAAIILSACGQVITPHPTETPEPRQTPTATQESRESRSDTSIRVASSGDAATPTITPTPIVHVVQKGDTLQAIAFDFGVSLDALQRVNGIENPQYLQVGQQLTIPVDETSRQSSPNLLLPTPTPHPILVQGVAFYETPARSVIGLGEVVNTTAITLTNVQVQVTLTDTDGEPLIQADTFVSMDIVPPETRCPFSILFASPPPDWEGHQVTVLRGQEAGVLASGYVPTSVINAEGGPLGPQFQVQGIVKNVSSDRIAESVDIFITTYDAQGIVTGYRRAPLPTAEGLYPGEERSFSVMLQAHGNSPDDFNVAILGRTANRTNSGE